MRRTGLSLIAAAFLFAFANGASAQDTNVSMTQAEFISHCAGNEDWCYKQIWQEAMAYELDEGTCIPDGISDDVMEKDVLDWMRAHPELGSRDSDATIDDAIDAIWPCSSN